MVENHYQEEGTMLVDLIKESIVCFFGKHSEMGVKFEWD